MKFLVTPEYEISKLIIKSFIKEGQTGWGKISTNILNENLLSFVAFDGDDLINIVFDKNKNELLGEDVCLIDENKTNALKVKLATIINEHSKR